MRFSDGAGTPVAVTGVAVSDRGRTVSSNFSNSKTLIVCETLSSVRTKSSAVRPSIGLPSLSVTVTVWTTSWVATLKVKGVCCSCAAVGDKKQWSDRASARTALTYLLDQRANDRVII